jgi:hypothetical protein
MLSLRSPPQLVLPLATPPTRFLLQSVFGFAVGLLNALIATSAFRSP